MGIHDHPVLIISLFLFTANKLLVEETQNLSIFELTDRELFFF